MCGILGSVNLPIRQETLDLIRHRGPDGHDLICQEIGPHQVYLAHRRLAVVDLSPAGHQPMATPASDAWITFNGEIYNHKEIRSGLNDIAWRGHSDTETILHALDSDGMEALKLFNGIFGIGFLHRRQARLYLVRDPFGVKPVYYWQQGNRFGFSSEIRPLQALVNDTPNLENLAELLLLRYSPSPDTLFTNIRKLRPGHVLEIDLSDTEIETREYSYLAPIPERESLGFEEALVRYGELFEQTIERQLMADVEIGVLLSGGIDSALVAAAAQRCLSRPLKAFTVGFNDRDDTDEIEDAAETARLLGMDHHITRIGFEDFLGSLEHCLGIVEEPLATTSIIPMFYLSELASRQVKVVLSGQGADESLGGYPRYQGELLRRWLPTRLAVVGGTLARLVGVRRDRVLRGFDALVEPRELERFIITYAVVEPVRIYRLIGYEPTRAADRINYFRELLCCERQLESVERMMSLDLRMNLADDLLLYTDKLTMHHSLECRVPMLDLKLVRFIESLPRAYRVRCGQGKLIHKRYAERILPRNIVYRPKKRFQSPTRIWFRQGDVLRERLLDPGSAFANYFDLSEVGKMLREHERGYNRERQIFLLLAIHHWLATFSQLRL